MPKRATPLTARGIERERRPGLYADGGGLYLCVARGGSKSWIYRYQIDGRRRDMGLGPISLVSLAQARDRVIDLRRGLRDGIDPLDAKRQERAARKPQRSTLPTYADCAAAYIEAHIGGWSDKRSWPDSMRLYVNPVIGDQPIATIDLGAVLRVLEPIWASRTETAKRVRGRIEAVLDYATVRGFRSGENPARWRGNLDKLLARPSRIARAEHHPALHWREMPEFMLELRRHEGMAVSALEFAILTCARAGEVLGALWPETDLARRVWTIPAARMKAGREHRVPLSDPALAVLDRVAWFKNNRDDHIFLSRKSGRPLTSPALLNSLARVRRGITVHGFRSSFRDWVADETDSPPELAEMALAHQVGSAVERAYLRSDGFDRRRALADAWGAYCGGVA